jgi:hypothetical protein
MARGSSRAESERGDRLRAQATSFTQMVDKLEADGMSTPKFRRDAEEFTRGLKRQANVEDFQEAVTNPQAMANLVNFEAKDGGFRMNIVDADGKEIDLKQLNAAGPDRRVFDKSDFTGLFGRLSQDTKDEFSDILMRKAGMSEKDARTAVDMIEERARAQIAPDYPSFAKQLQDPAVQRDLSARFRGLAALRDRTQNKINAAERSRNDPSDDGSANIEAYYARVRLDNELAYLNEARQRISEIAEDTAFFAKMGKNGDKTQAFVDKLIMGAMQKSVKENSGFYYD